MSPTDRLEEVYEMAVGVDNALSRLTGHPLGEPCDAIVADAAVVAVKLRKAALEEFSRRERGVL